MHENFRRLMVDIEIYVDRIASMRIRDMNTSLEVTRQKLLHQGRDEYDLDLRTIESAMIDEDEYFSHTVHRDMDHIIRDIREAHRDDKSTADVSSGAEMVRQFIEEAAQMDGSEKERQAKLFCAQLGINYSKLSPEEFYALVEILKKSKFLKGYRNQRGKGGYKKSVGK